LWFATPNYIVVCCITSLYAATYYTAIYYAATYHSASGYAATECTTQALLEDGKANHNDHWG
jgi:hypothetical protein